MDPRDDSTAKKKVSGIFLSSFSVIIQSEPVTIKQNESVLGYAVANINCGCFIEKSSVINLFI